MRKQDIINNLKAVKAVLRDSREVARTSLGVIARSVIGAEELLPLGLIVDSPRRSYRPDDRPFSVELVTPPSGHYMHTFYDVDPLSPSGRYLAVTRVPFIWRIPYPGDVAQVCVVDLQEQTLKAIYNTVGWGAQLGANVQWGCSDETIYCNDVLDGRGRGVEINVRTLETRVLDGPIYGLSPDRTQSYSACLELINAGTVGYGVPERMFNKTRQEDRLSHKDGIWKTDIRSGRRELFLSVHDIVRAIPGQNDLRGGTYYIFNVKVSPDGEKLLCAIFTRGAPGRLGWPMQLVTCSTDGSNVQLAVPDSLWRYGGHHANWHPDGRRIVMNLRPRAEPMGFYTFQFDGSDLTRIAPGIKGGGHPSIEKSGRYLVTDAYVSEGLSNDQGEVPIRLIDLKEGVEDRVCYVYTNKISGPRRVDPHPVWTHSHGVVAFNGLAEGRRQVFLADVCSGS